MKVSALVISQYGALKARKSSDLILCALVFPLSLLISSALFLFFFLTHFFSHPLLFLQWFLLSGNTSKPSLTHQGEVLFFEANTWADSLFIPPPPSFLFCPLLSLFSPSPASSVFQPFLFPVFSLISWSLHPCHPTSPSPKVFFAQFLT